MSPEQPHAAQTHAGGHGPVSRRERPKPPEGVEAIMKDVRNHMARSGPGGDAARDGSNSSRLFENQLSAVFQMIDEAKSAVNNQKLWETAARNMGLLLHQAGYKNHIAEALEIERRIFNLYLKDDLYPDNHKPTEETRTFVMNDLLLSHMTPEQLDAAIQISDGPSSAAASAQSPSFWARMASSLRPTRPSATAVSRG